MWDRIFDRAAATMAAGKALMIAHPTMLFAAFGGGALLGAGLVWLLLRQQTKLHRDTADHFRERLNRIESPPTASVAHVVRSRLEGEFSTAGWDRPLQVITQQTYRNVTVELDGREFVECKFENVALSYQGRKPTRITNCTRSAEVQINTENPVVINVIGIFSALGLVKQLYGSKYQ